ncbi:DUF6168 family protein [Aquimarina sediminis]|uniref:DUF6168 family protein n=1 Tax=Aquimarina sediminis TaxID=2070536 RepID=UPI001F4E7816|nr:DUF6168 family protein [Aquimarina sediminis]
MIKSLFRFLFLFFIVIIGSYFIHMWVIEAFLLKRDISIVKLSYLFNGLFTFVLTSAIILVSKKYKDHLGFIFMAGSLLKIGVFMAISKLGGIEINKNVFLDFFAAYLICLILEVYFVSKILNSDK